MPATLEQIVEATRRRLAIEKPMTNRDDLARRAALHAPRGFAAALRRAAASGPAVIAELKKASPSRGVIRGTLHVSALASELVEGGAAALSIITDEKFFQGSLTNLLEASVSVDLPCLRKDFIVDEFQILEARAHGADAVLLIAAVLNDTELRKLRGTAAEFGLDALCEVHSRDELSRALDAGFDLIGVNNRDLRTFDVDPNTAIGLIRDVPPGVLKVAESGIQSGQQMRELREAGYEAFLIGEWLMRADHPGEALRQLLADATAKKTVERGSV